MSATCLGRIKVCSAFLLSLFLSACSTAPAPPHTGAPFFRLDYPEKLNILEPGPQEVVIVVNDNIRMSHAGMFVGHLMLDPAGSYLAVREQQTGWQGTSLEDYVRFQLEDGPAVQLYRFHLPADRFADLKNRVEKAGRTMPLFCAAKVQNLISGIPPFSAVPTAWLVAPATVARHLDLLIKSNDKVGVCVWPDGSSCYPAP